MIAHFKKPILALLLAGLLPLAAHAHRSWLLPSSTQAEGKEPWVTVDAAVSENLFDFDANAVKLEGLAIIGPDGSAVNPENSATGRLRSSFDLKLAKPGTYKVSIVTEPISATYKLNGETKRWRGVAMEALEKEVPPNAEELRVTRAHNRLETFVSAGKPDQAALKTTGVGLELEPITHPNDLMVGEKANFRLLLDGKPLPNLKLSVVPGGVRYRGVLKEITVVTNAKGEFSVKWPEAGMYWVNASYPPRERTPANPQQPQAGVQPVQGSQQNLQNAQPQRRLSYSATLEVLPQ